MTDFNRRDPINTIAGQRALVDDAMRPRPNPAFGISPEERAIFNDIVDSRESSTWSPHEIRLATILSQQMRRINEMGKCVDRDGSAIIHPATNALVANPELKGLVSLLGATARLTSLLGLSASGRAVTNSDQQRRNIAEREARRAIAAAAGQDPDNLIAL